MKVSRPTLAIASLLAVFLSAPAQAQSADEINQIIRQLAPIAGQTLAPAITLTAPAPIATQPIATQPLPSQHVLIEVVIEERIIVIDPTYAMDFEVYFAFDSAELTVQGRTDLSALGQALASPELRPYSYLVAGHTDAVGNAGYNQQLSKRRAVAARNYLIETFAIDPNRLLTIGFGEARLRDAANPTSGINRRVEVAMIVH